MPDFDGANTPLVTNLFQNVHFCIANGAAGGLEFGVYYKNVCNNFVQIDEIAVQGVKHRCGACNLNQIMI